MTEINQPAASFEDASIAVRDAERNTGALVLEKLTDLRRGLFSDAEAFALLTRREQSIFIGFLRDTGASAITLGQRYNLTTRDILALIAEDEAHIGDLVRRTSLDSVIGRLFLAYDKVTSELAQRQKWEAYWRTNRELVRDLQRLGVVHETPRQVEMMHTHQLSEAQAQELARLRELDEKRAKRYEEIKQAEIDSVDPIPLIGTTDHEDHD